MYSTVSEYFWLFLDWDGSPQRIANLRIVERYSHNRWKLYNVHSKTRTVLHSILPKPIVIKPKLQPSTTTPKKMQTKNTCKKTGSWQISGLQSLKTNGWHQPKAGACHSLCFDWRWNPVRPKAFLVSSLCSKLCFLYFAFSCFGHPHHIRGSTHHKSYHTVRTKQLHSKGSYCDFHL